MSVSRDWELLVMTLLVFIGASSIIIKKFKCKKKILRFLLASLALTHVHPMFTFQQYRMGKNKMV